MTKEQMKKEKQYCMGGLESETLKLLSSIHFRGAPGVEGSNDGLTMSAVNAMRDIIAELGHYAKLLRLIKEMEGGAK